VFFLIQNGFSTVSGLDRAPESLTVQALEGVVSEETNHPASGLENALFPETKAVL
jgi:hypothetical protein